MVDYSSAEAVAHFEAIWAGHATGFSEAYFREDLAELHRLRQGLTDRTIPPRQVIGTGYKQPRRLAFEYLADRIAKCERDLASRGRTSTVNQSNVRHHLRQAA